MVFRSFSAQVPVTGAFRVTGNLGGASLATAVTGSETENRVASCADPSGVPTFVDLGTVSVTISADWTATGPTAVVQPGIEARPATATGSLVGPNTLAVGSLGTSTFAELRRSQL